MDRFYNELSPFTDFEEIANIEAYRPVPEDWIVLATDISGSTRAIEEGRYKDVNMLGAASITVVLNVCGDIDIPYVFGGDGATLVVPRTLADNAARALAGLKAVSSKIFGLALRVGIVPVADVRSRGHDIAVRKYRLSPGNHLAMFAGGGIECVDRLIKDPDSRVNFEAPVLEDLQVPDLQGLSCRWNPLVPHRGRVAAIMVQALGENPDRVVRDTMGAISEILGGDVNNAAPANPFSMRFRWPPEGLAIEARATAGRAGFLLRYLKLLGDSFLQYCCERLKTQIGAYNAPVYRKEVQSNTDFRKFDGMLRLVLDVTPEQSDAIANYLDGQFQARRLVYGMHAASNAIMTCLVFSLEQSEHVHFIDAAEGGYAMAAKGFKERLAVTDVVPSRSRP